LHEPFGALSLDEFAGDGFFTLAECLEPLGVVAKTSPAVLHRARALSSHQHIHALVWVLACWDENSLRENSVLFEKRYLVVTKQGMQGGEFSRGGLDHSELIEPIPDGYSAGWLGVCGEERACEE
jgi:hypothetical protein